MIDSEARKEILSYTIQALNDSLLIEKRNSQIKESIKNNTLITQEEIEKTQKREEKGKEKVTNRKKKQKMKEYKGIYKKYKKLAKKEQDLELDGEQNVKTEGRGVRVG